MAAMTTIQVSTAAAELAQMRASLASWLKFRTINDAVLAGQIVAKKPAGYAKRAITAGRDMAAEQDLADKLSALLAELMPDVRLPNADLRSNPNGAVELARIALSGKPPVSSNSAVATGSVAHPWMWPALIVGGLLLAVTTAIKSAADVAKDSEEKACIMAGACTDYGFWLKAGGVTALAWFAWRELGLGDTIKSLIKSKRRA